MGEKTPSPQQQQQYKPSGPLLSSTLTTARAWSAHQWTGRRILLSRQAVGIFQFSVNLLKSYIRREMPQDKAPVCREQLLDLVNVLVCSLVLSVATTLFSILVKYYSSISFLNRSAADFRNFEADSLQKVSSQYSWLHKNCNAQKGNFNGLLFAESYLRIFRNKVFLAAKATQ